MPAHWAGKKWNQQLIVSFNQCSLWANREMYTPNKAATTSFRILPRMSSWLHSNEPRWHISKQLAQDSWLVPLLYKGDTMTRIEALEWHVFFECRPRGGWGVELQRQRGLRIISAVMPPESSQGRRWLVSEFLLTWQVIFGNQLSRDISSELWIGHLLLQYIAEENFLQPHSPHT